MNKNSCGNFASASIKGGCFAPEICGKVEFRQMNGYVLITAKIHNLPRTDCGFFGFHIHDGVSCCGKEFAQSGSHYNPQDTLHPCHAGDLPPLLRCNNGAFAAFATDRFKLSDVIGKTVIIHDNPDDFITQPSGNSGKKIACGIIKQ